MQSHLEKSNSLPGVDKKINEYVDRIKAGESKDSVLQGLGNSWVSAVEEKISESKIDSVNETLQENDKNLINKTEEFSKEKIEEFKKLAGWPASYELVKIAQQEKVDLSSLSREGYAAYAVKNHLTIDDGQLRAHPSQRKAISVDDLIQIRKQERLKVSAENDKNFHQFSHEMVQLAEKPQAERFISKDVRILSGTKESHSWLYFAINNGMNTVESDTFKSYFAVKDLNQLTPEKFKDFMKTLQENNYNGGVKIFQEMVEQGAVLNDQVVMHGYSEADAKLALQIAESYFKGELASTSFGKDEKINGESKSYSQVLAETIRNKVANNELLELVVDKKNVLSNSGEGVIDIKSIKEDQVSQRITQDRIEIEKIRKELGISKEPSSEDLGQVENVENDPDFKKMYEQMVLDQFKKDFPIDFERTYEPLLNEDLELVPKNKKDIPVLASNSITMFKNTDVFKLKEKALERYKTIKETYIEKDIATQVEKIYNDTRKFTNSSKFQNYAPELDKITQKILFHDPQFKEYLEGSQRVFGDDEATANMDALGTYLSRRGYQIAGY